jgi:DNA-binding transcriptional regulator LsrR (DeoR family)
MPRRPLQRIQAITVARRYFMERQTKRGIGKDLGISRFKVARLIDEAIEEGLVRFEIDDAGELDAQLSDRLREKYSLRNALVLAGPHGKRRERDRLSPFFADVGRRSSSGRPVED